jgi:hypothetical protein
VNLTPMWQGVADPSGPILAAPLTSPVSPFNEARQVFGVGGFAYTTGIPTPQKGGQVLAEHVQQVRDALR